MRLDDERSNLNKEVDGIIVVFGNLGLWNGRRQGYQILGSTIADILKSSATMQNGTATATTFADGWTIMTVRTIPYTVSPKAVTKRNVSPIRFTTVKSTKKASAGEHVPLSVCSRRVRLENKAAQAGQGRIKMLPAKYRNAPARGGYGILY